MDPETTPPAADFPPSPPRFELLSIGGDHAERFLQRMLSNAVAGLAADRAAPAFLLEPTGRIVAGAAFLRDGEGFLAVCPAGWASALRDGLLHYRIADRVSIEPDPRTAVWQPNAGLGAAAEIPWGVGGDDGVVTLRWPWTGLDEHVRIGDPAAVAPTDTRGIEAERIAAGSPAFGREITSSTIPVEAALVDWLSATKGCYVGQEVVERMWSRDRVARRLVGFVGEGAGPLPAAQVELRGARGAVLTSLAEHPELGRIALGWLPTGADPDTPLSDPAGETWRPRPLPLAGGRRLPIRRLQEG